MATVTPKDLRQQGGFTTSDPRLRVDVSPDDLLKFGRHVVTLQVKDAAGNTGTAQLTIQVIDRQNPNAVPTLLDIETLAPIDNVHVGVSFILSGEESFDPEGTQITEYNWRLLSPTVISPIGPTPIDPIVRPVG